LCVVAEKFALEGWKVLKDGNWKQRLTSGKFWLQFWMLKKFSKMHMSRNYVSNKWKEMAKLNYLAATIIIKCLATAARLARAMCWHMLATN